MKKHIRSSRIICIALAILILLSLASCTEEPDTEPSENEALFSTEVERYKAMLKECGNYIYTRAFKLSKYDRRTGIITDACTDPECDGRCLLETPTVMFSSVTDGKLYVAAEVAFSQTYQLSALDVATGEFTVLREYDANTEGLWSANPIARDGYVYFNRRVLKEGGDKTNPEDYIPVLFRVSADGKSENVVAPLLKDSEQLMYVYDGRAFTYYDGKFSSINIETAERKTVFDAVAAGYRNALGYSNFLKNKLYITIGGDGVTKNTQLDLEYPNSYLVRIDLDTGEYEQIVDAPVLSFSLSDDAIYYSLLEYRVMYLPEDYELRPENVRVFLASAELYRADLDGKNPKVVYTNEKMDYEWDYTVIDGVLYGYLFDWLEDEHGFGNMYFGKIDLKTGEVTPAVKQ